MKLKKPRKTILAEETLINGGAEKGFLNKKPDNSKTPEGLLDSAFQNQSAGILTKRFRGRLLHKSAVYVYGFTCDGTAAENEKYEITHDVRRIFRSNDYKPVMKNRMKY